MQSFTTTHQYFVSPYLLPIASRTPVTRQMSPDTVIGHTVTSSSTRKHNALVLALSVPIAVNVSTAITTSIPSHDPTDAMCSTNTAFRVRAPNRHGRTAAVASNVALLISLSHRSDLLTYRS
jgi:hypothetical protein